MEKYTIKEKGITIIALTVTIIILLIIAGVSIAFLTGENGIITKAKNAKNDSLTSQERENYLLSSYSDTIEKNVYGSINGLKKYLSEQVNLSDKEIVENTTYLSELLTKDEAINYILNDNNLLENINNKLESKKIFISSNNVLIKLKDKCNISDIDIASLVPILTSNTTTSTPNVTCGIASESSSWCDRFAYLSFNGNVINNSINNCWQATTNAPSVGTYVKYNSPTKDTIFKARVGTWDNNSGSADKSWTTYIRGSNNGTDWNKISNSVEINVQNSAIKYFDYEINNFIPYNYYELYFDGSATNTQFIHVSYLYSCSLMFLQFYGFENNDLLNYYISNL